MFNVNDYIMYGTTGVCKVLDIKKEKNMDDVEEDYYVLHPVYTDNGVIKIPVNNDKIFMRSILSEKDVASIISQISEYETIWEDDGRKRNEKFKSILKMGKCEGWIQLIKSIKLKKRENKSAGRNMYQADEEIMKSAKKLLFQEFATVLKIQPDEVSSYITSHGNI